jgi:lysophospholipase L1-like esterase
MNVIRYPYGCNHSGPTKHSARRRLLLAVAPVVVSFLLTACSYVHLGDSNGFGAVAERPFVQRYAETIGADAVTNASQPGATVGDALRDLRIDQTLRRAVAEADVVSVGLGGNDALNAVSYCLAEQMPAAEREPCLDRFQRRFEQDWSALLDEVRALNPDVALITLTLYHPFPGVEDDRLRAVNRYIVLTTWAHGGCVARVDLAFNGPDGMAFPNGLLADLIHPNEEGHRAIAEAMEHPICRP